jgi:hypothetical protein
MKRLMYLSISILCLSVAALIGFYIGSESAQAQAEPPQPIAGFADFSGAGCRGFESHRAYQSYPLRFQFVALVA